MLKQLLQKVNLTSSLNFPGKYIRMINIGFLRFLWNKKLYSIKKKILSFKAATAEYFLAFRNGEIVGRIAAIKNDIHLKLIMIQQDSLDFSNVSTISKLQMHYLIQQNPG